MLLKLSSSNRNLHSVNWHINILSSTQSTGQGYAHFDCEYLVNGYTVTGQVNVTIAINVALTICCRMLVSFVDLSPRFDILIKHIIMSSDHAMTADCPGRHALSHTAPAVSCSCLHCGPPRASPSTVHREFRCENRALSVPL